MPVVISVLNSFSGWSTCAAGFTIFSSVLIIGGALVGASGAILAYIMCRAMNRPFFAVMAGGFGVKSGSSRAKKEKQSAQEWTVETLVDEILGCSSIVIVPGYGMAVSQAQHIIANLTALLGEHGIEVLAMRSVLSFEILLCVCVCVCVVRVMRLYHGLCVFSSCRVVSFSGICPWELACWVR